MSATCPECGFSGPAARLEELAHLHFLLGEMANWTELPPTLRDRLQARYLRRRRELEIALGLREPPPSPEEARLALQERLRLRQLLRLLDVWQERSWIHPAAAGAQAERVKARLRELDARLAQPGTPQVEPFEDQGERIALLRSLGQDIEALHAQGAWVDEAAYRSALEDLEARAARLEIELGLRLPEKKPPPRPAAAPPPAPAAPPRPREPLTWERVWRTLLSERTLRALLFVGVFLLFASAVTLVVYNWERFSPWIQVAFLSGFTLFFYDLGWYVRTGMRLVNSGLALTATASLLVPVDFYAIYLSGGIFPRTAWAEVWLLASAVCLVAYTVTAFLLRAEFFGYLTGVAMGSLWCAVLQVAGVSSDWWGPALGGMASVAMWFKVAGQAGLREVFVPPFHHLALLSITAIVLLASGFRIAQGIARPSFRTALALDWWLAWAIYVLGAGRYLRHMLSSGACLAAPVALYLTLELVFEAHGIRPAWYALGWALLTPLYLTVSWRLWKSAPEIGRTIVSWAVTLTLLAAGWALQEMRAAAASHAVLMGSVILATVLW
ncbi:MAG: hypothetical protein N2508_15150, partial [Anaerolineae bacterium]|nr:hypothetical protein [Anaerolineae bacterium]